MSRYKEPQFCPLCDVSLDLHSGDDSCDLAASKADTLSMFYAPFVRHPLPLAVKENSA